MTKKPPLKIYRDITFFFGKPPETVYTADQAEQVLMNAQLMQENDRLRKELEELRANAINKALKEDKR